MERSHYDIMTHLVRLDHSLDKLFIYPKHSLGVERLIAWFLFTVHQSQELSHNPWKDHSQLHALRTRDKTHKAKKNAEMQVEVRLVNRISTNADHLSTEHSQDSMPLSYLIIVLANRRKVLHDTAINLQYLSSYIHYINIETPLVRTRDISLKLVRKFQNF